MAHHHAAGLTVFAATLLLVIGCAEPTPERPPLPEPEEPLSQLLEARQREHALAAVRETTRLVNVTEKFLDDPNTHRGEQMQLAWRTAHESWVRAAVLVPDPADTIDPWPVQPGFFDSLPAYPESGFVEDDKVALTEAGLRHQHQFTDPSEVSLGLHVLEYYAFDRPVEDFASPATGGERRRVFVNLVAGLLLKDQLTWSRQFDLDDDLVPAGLPRTLDELTRLVSQRIEGLYADLRRVEIHGEYSDARLQAIRVVLEELDALMRGRSRLADYLGALDAAQAETFFSTLDQARAQLQESAVLDEDEASHLLLLLAALNHQAQDLLKLLPGGEAQI